MWYFAYGSNLNYRAVAEWCRHCGLRAPAMKAARPAVLDNYRLCFPIYSEYWGGGIADIASTNGDEAFDNKDDVRGVKSGALGALFQNNFSNAMTISNSNLASFSQVGVLAHERVELGQVLVEAEDVGDGRQRRLGAGGQQSPAARPLLDEHPLRAASRQRDGRLQRARLLVDPVRWQVRDPVRDDRAPEVDRLAARAAQEEGRLHRTAGSYFCSQRETEKASPGVPPKQRIVVPASTPLAERVASGSGTWMNVPAGASTSCPSIVNVARPLETKKSSSCFVSFSSCSPTSCCPGSVPT